MFIYTDGLTEFRQMFFLAGAVALVWKNGLKFKNVLLMKPTQVSKVPFEPGMESFYVDDDEEKYLVRRVFGLNNGVCPGEHLHQIDNNANDTDSVLEVCKAYEIFQACQHSFTCECVDYSKGNDCKHILLGEWNKNSDLFTDNSA